MFISLCLVNDFRLLPKIQGFTRYSFIVIGLLSTKNFEKEDGTDIITYNYSTFQIRHSFNDVSKLISLVLP